MAVDGARLTLHKCLPFFVIPAIQAGIQTLSPKTKDPGKKELDARLKSSGMTTKKKWIPDGAGMKNKENDSEEGRGIRTEREQEESGASEI